MAGEREESVLFATRYKMLDDVPPEPDADADWAQIIAVRNEVSKQIETLRVDGKIGSALDANVCLYAGGNTHKVLHDVGDELRFILITSEASLSPLSEAPPQANATEVDELKVMVSALEVDKCVRCWHRRPDVGLIEAHPELCGRCVENIDGDGESRLIA
jgi:isoleucyl-tRNA synthetase